MKLVVRIASCTAITLTPERPKPQLQRANNALALRDGGAGSAPAPVAPRSSTNTMVYAQAEPVHSAHNRLD